MASKLTLVFLSFLIIAASPPVDAVARDKLQAGPKIGAQIPSALAAIDQSGKKRSFDTIKGNKGLILVFSRSLHW